MYLLRKFDILLYTQSLLLNMALSFVQKCMTVVFTQRYLRFEVWIYQIAQGWQSGIINISFRDILNMHPCFTNTCLVLNLFIKDILREYPAFKRNCLISFAVVSSLSLMQFSIILSILGFDDFVLRLPLRLSRYYFQHDWKVRTVLWTKLLFVIMFSFLKMLQILENTPYFSLPSNRR